MGLKKYILFLSGCVTLIIMASCSNKSQNETLDLIVYVEDKNISIMETTGRKIENITMNTSDEYSYVSPLWNPDGSKIAFLKHPVVDAYPTQLIIVDYSIDGIFYYDPFLKEDEQNRIITKSLDYRKMTIQLDLDDLVHHGETICAESKIAFDWITENELIMFCQKTSPQLEDIPFFTLSLDGEQIKMVETSFKTILSGSLIDSISHIDTLPNSEMILISSTSQGKVFMYDTLEKELKFLFEGTYPKWSSNGEKIAYEKEADLYIYDLQSDSHSLIYDHGENINTPRDLTDKEFTTEWLKNILVDFNSMAWGPEDSEIYFTATRYHVSTPSIYKIDLLTMQITTMTVDESHSPSFHSFPCNHDE